MKNYKLHTIIHCFHPDEEQLLYGMVKSVNESLKLKSIAADIQIERDKDIPKFSLVIDGKDEDKSRVAVYLTEAWQVYQSGYYAEPDEDYFNNFADERMEKIRKEQRKEYRAMNDVIKRYGLPELKSINKDSFIQNEQGILVFDWSKLKS